jgi:hypothetical protein
MSAATATAPARVPLSWRPSKSSACAQMRVTPLDQTTDESGTAVGCSSPLEPDQTNGTSTAEPSKTAVATAPHTRLLVAAIGANVPSGPHEPPKVISATVRADRQRYIGSGTYVLPRR